MTISTIQQYCKPVKLRYLLWHFCGRSVRPSVCHTRTLFCSGVGTYLSGTARAVPLLKVGRLVMHFAVPLFGHRLYIALMIGK